MGKTKALFKSLFETWTFLNFDKPNLGSNRTIVCLSSLLLGHCGHNNGYECFINGIHRDQVDWVNLVVALRSNTRYIVTELGI